MKILLYFEGKNFFKHSGVGRAYQHQKRALEYAGFEITTDKYAKDYDICYINTYGLSAIRMAKRAKKLGKKIVIHAHSTEEDFRDSFIFSNKLSHTYRNYLVHLYTQADVIITPSEYCKNLLIQYGIEKPMFVISNGVYLPKYQPNAFKEKAFREIFDLKADDKVVIACGGFFERKGIFDFVEIAKYFPNVRFIWFGYVNQAVIPPHISKLVKKEHPKNVEFPGHIKGDIVEGAYSTSNAILFPSFEENEGIVVLEGLASKQKVIIRDIPVYEEWLRDGVNCLKASSVEEFLDQLKKALESPMESLRDQAYEVAKSKSIPQIANQLKDVFTGLLDSK